MKERKKPEKFMLPHGRPSDDRSFAFSSRVPSKAAKIKALINYGIIRIGIMEIHTCRYLPLINMAFYIEAKSVNPRFSESLEAIPFPRHDLHTISTFFASMSQ